MPAGSHRVSAINHTSLLHVTLSLSSARRKSPCLCNKPHKFGPHYLIFVQYLQEVTMSLQYTTHVCPRYPISVHYQQEVTVSLQQSTHVCPTLPYLCPLPAGSHRVSAIHHNRRSYVKVCPELPYLGPIPAGRRYVSVK